MLNFRMEIRRVKSEGVTRDEQDLEKQVDFLLEAVLNSLKREMYTFKFMCTHKLVFSNTGDVISVKASANHSSDLFSFVNSNSSEIFNVLKQKIKSEKFEIYDEEESSFTIYLD